MKISYFPGTEVNHDYHWLKSIWILESNIFCQKLVVPKALKNSNFVCVCLCTHVTNCKICNHLWLTQIGYLFFAKKSICKPKMFSLEKVRFLWVLHVLQLWTMRGGDDGLWLFMRIWNAIECLFVRCSCTQRSRSCWKKRSMNGSRRFVGSNENVIITEEFQIVRTLDPLFVFLAQFNRSLFTRQFFQTQQKVHVRTSKGPKWTFKRTKKNLKNLTRLQLDLKIAQNFQKTHSRSKK